MTVATDTQDFLAAGLGWIIEEIEPFAQRARRDSADWDVVILVRVRPDGEAAGIYVASREVALRDLKNEIPEAVKIIAQLSVPGPKLGVRTLVMAHGELYSFIYKFQGTEGVLN
jgi:hypothetical protein